MSGYSCRSAAFSQADAGRPRYMSMNGTLHGLPVCCAAASRRSRGSMWMCAPVRAVFIQAINYFSIDNNVSVKVWENDFADKYEDLALLAIDAGEYKTAKACKDAALECRRRACEAAEKTVRGLRYSSFLPKSRPKSWVSRNGVSRSRPEVERGFLYSI